VKDQDKTSRIIPLIVINVRAKLPSQKSSFSSPAMAPENMLDAE
jgi:hypothetical protein